MYKTSYFLIFEYSKNYYNRNQDLLIFTHLSLTDLYYPYNT